MIGSWRFDMRRHSRAETFASLETRRRRSRELGGFLVCQDIGLGETEALFGFLDGSTLAETGLVCLRVEPHERFLLPLFIEEEAKEGGLRPLISLSHSQPQFLCFRHLGRDQLELLADCELLIADRVVTLHLRGAAYRILSEDWFAAALQAGVA